MPRVSPDLGTGRASLGLVFDHAWEGGEFTASDAMAVTGLTRSTTIDAIDTLVEAGMLRELPNARDVGQYRAGRPARRFALPADLGCVAGIDAGDTHVSVTLTDLSGGVLSRRRIDVDPLDTPDRRRETIIAHLRTALTEADVEPERLLAVCAGVAAPVARDGTSPPHPEGFWERTNPGLVTALAAESAVVRIENDALLAAAAEGQQGAAIGCRDYIALLAGERLGSGVVIDGHPLHGAHGGVGEMYAFDIVRGVDSAFGLGPSIVALTRELIASGDVDPAGALGGIAADDADARDVLAAAAAGDPDALRVAESVGDALARIVGVLGSMFDPKRIVVCGAIADGIDPVLDAARRVLPQLTHLPAPELVRSELGSDIVSAGAVVEALRAAREVAVPQLAEQRLRGVLVR